VPDSTATLPDTDWRPTAREPGTSAVTHVYQNLRDQIINLKFEPGTPIAKNIIADRFKVSPTPVREALLRLSEENLVDIIPQSGTTVSLINIQSAQEIHFLRLSVEIEVAQVLCERITDTGLLELSKRGWNGK
jgi:DNA-binding GntR family transcriptional regulator